MFKIQWKSKKTGVTGEGKAVFATKAQAQAVCDMLNKDTPELSHWPAEQTGTVGRQK